MVSTSAVSGMFKTRNNTLKDAWLAIATRPPSSSCVPSPGLTAFAGPEPALASPLLVPPTRPPPHAGWSSPPAGRSSPPVACVGASGSVEAASRTATALSSWLRVPSLLRVRAPEGTGAVLPRDTAAQLSRGYRPPC
jgi:hypothetical protein